MGTDIYKWSPFPDRLKKREVWPSLGGSVHHQSTLEKDTLARIGSVLILNSMVTLGKALGQWKIQWPSNLWNPKPKTNWIKEIPKDFGRDGHEPSYFLNGEIKTSGQTQRMSGIKPDRFSVAFHDSVVKSFTKISKQASPERFTKSLTKGFTNSSSNLKVEIQTHGGEESEQAFQVLSCAILIKLCILQALTEQKILRDLVKEKNIKDNCEEAFEPIEVLSTNNLEVNNLAANFLPDQRMANLNNHEEGEGQRGGNNGRDHLPRVPDFYDDEMIGFYDGEMEEPGVGGAGAGGNNRVAHFDENQLCDKWMENPIVDHEVIEEYLNPLADEDDQVPIDDAVLNPLDAGELHLLNQLEHQVDIIDDLVEELMNEELDPADAA